MKTKTSTSGLFWLSAFIIATGLPPSSLAASASAAEKDESLDRLLSEAPSSIPSGINDPKPRIIQGDRSDPSQRPFFAQSGYDNYPQTSEILCGAALVSRDIAISAAHCQGAFNYGIRVLDSRTGGYDRMVPVSEQVRHPKWDQDRNSLNFDLLILKLQTPLAADDVAQPISYNTDPNYPSNGQRVMAMGFGITETNSLSNYLREGEFEYITNEECFGRNIQFNNVRNGDEVMCTDPIAGSSTCLGDSGGPLTNSDGTRLLGVVSFGSGCQADQIPDGYARISAMSAWIREQICEISDFPPSNCPATGRSSLDVKMRLHFQHSFWSDEVTFAVREQSTRNIVHTGPRYTPERGAKEIEEFYLAPGDYTFEVVNTDGSGLLSKGQGSDGSWFLTALYDGSTETRVADGDSDFGQEQYTDFSVAGSPPTNAAMESCLMEKDQEEISCNLAGTSCQCSNSGVITCFNGSGQVCRRRNQSCGTTSDCCGGRTCRAGFCKAQNTNRDRNKNRLGGNGIIGGVAGRERGGSRLRGRR